MKRLFCVKHGNSIVNLTQEFAEKYPNLLYGDDHDGTFFEKKMNAKHFRDMLGNQHHVSRGPDHIGPHGMGRVPHMRRQPKHKDF